MEAIGEVSVVEVLERRYLDLEAYLVATYRLEHRHTVLGEIMVKTVARVMREQGKYDPARSAPFSWIVGLARLVALHELIRRGERKGVKQDKDLMEDGSWTDGACFFSIEPEAYHCVQTPEQLLILEQTPPWESL